MSLNDLLEETTKHNEFIAKRSPFMERLEKLREEENEEIKEVHKKYEALEHDLMQDISKLGEGPSCHHEIGLDVLVSLGEYGPVSMHVCLCCLEKLEAKTFQHFIKIDDVLTMDELKELRNQMLLEIERIACFISEVDLETLVPMLTTFAHVEIAKNRGR